MILVQAPNLFRFARPDFLWALVLIPALFFIYWLASYQKKKQLRLFGDTELVRKLMPEASPFRRRWKMLLQLSAFFFLVFALAGPQFGSKLEEVKRRGVEIVIALDVSQSMLAEDIKPNRLDAAKRAVALLTSKLENDNLGLIVFGGQAYTQVAITPDYGAIRMFLDNINTDAVPVQGTNIGAAIELASKSFTPDGTKNKALILITDGENHQPEAIELAQEAAKKGITVHTIGFGLAKGAPIPVLGALGQKEFLTDGNGSVIISRLNENLLRQVAQAGNGVYVRASNSSSGLELIYDTINSMEKKEFEAQIFSAYEDHYQWLVGLVLALLLFDQLVLARKNKYLKEVKLFEKRLLE